MASSVVLGLDGVLANHRHRLHHIEKEPPDWRAFYGQDAVERDGSYPPMIRLCQQLAEANTIIILTERPITISEITRRWLRDRRLSCEAVFTRQDRSHDLVTDYKIEMLKRLKREGWKPWLVIDCDREVVRQAHSASGAQGMLVQGW